MFFTDIAEMVPLSEAFMTQAHLEAEQAGLDALDALPIAAAKLGGAAEFVATEPFDDSIIPCGGPEDDHHPAHKVINSG
jgi:hypothetical protein